MDEMTKALASMLIDKDGEEHDDDCELCDGTGEVSAITTRSDGDQIGCPACIERAHSRRARIALAAQPAAPVVEPGAWQMVKGATKLLADTALDRDFFERQGFVGRALYAAPPLCTQKVAHAFRAVDDIDWEHLDQFIPQSGHGRFWRAVFQEVRAALSTNPGEQE